MRPTLPSLIGGALIAGTLLAQGPSSGAGEADPRVIDVVSANLRWRHDPPPNNWALRRDRMALLLRSEGPDVVGLQEARPNYLDDLLARLPGYAAYAPPGATQNSLLYRTEALRLDRETSDAENARRDAPETDWGEGSVRLPVCARFVLRGSERGVYVYNNHFDHRFRESRRWSAGVLVDRIRTRRKDDPVILTGDFNARPGEDTMAFLRGEVELRDDGGPIANPVPFLDTFAHLHPAKVAGTYHGFRGIAFGRRIDYVFAGPGVRVLAARILRGGGDGYVSDHHPVAATLRLP